MSITHLKIGDKAPRIDGVDQNDEPISLEDYSGKKLVLFFYPKDLTPTCTIESCNLRDNYSLLKNEGYDVLGVSADKPKRHQKFVSTFKLPYKLLADVDKKVISAYGIWGEKKFMGRTFDGIHRVTFVINEKGIIEQIIDKVKSKNHTQQILENQPTESKT